MEGEIFSFSSPGQLPRREAKNEDPPIGGFFAFFGSSVSRVRRFFEDSSVFFASSVTQTTHVLRGLPHR